MRARAQYNASGCPFKVNVTMPARRLEEAHKLLDEVSNMLGDVRRELLGSGNRAQ